MLMRNETSSLHTMQEVTLPQDHTAKAAHVTYSGIQSQLNKNARYVNGVYLIPSHQLILYL